MSTASQNSEVGTRRKYPRRQFQRKLGILFEGRYWMGHGIEIGEGGVSFALGQELPNGRNLVVNFQVPGGSFISVQAEVKNLRQKNGSGQFAYGVSFKTLKFEAKREIRAYVSARTEVEN